MNSKCLYRITELHNPLQSIWPVEGDRFASLILESLKNIVKTYGEQVIVVQYFNHVSNTISACLNRITLRLEASLIAGIILVNIIDKFL